MNNITQYEYPDLVDKIYSAKKLLRVCLIAHSEIEDKDDVLSVLNDFLEPSLDKIIETLVIQYE
jgi:hypothetical protein